MLDRFRRSSKSAEEADLKSDKTSATKAPPPSAGPDEETVRIAHKDFRKRRNAGRWRLVRRLVLALLLVGLVAGSVWVVFFSSYVTAREVDVVGTRTIPDAKIEGAANVPIGTPLARVDMNAIVKRVQPIDAVRYVKVARGWPHTVRITITERTPIAVIDQGAGLKALDSEGVPFGGYKVRPKHLPLVRTEPGTPGEALAEGAKVVDALPPKIAGRVEAVDVASVDEIKLVLRSGRKVVWGSAEDSGQKAEVLAVLLKQPGNQIDVTVPGRPTTR
jgi:cell division protein FtsQ